jgi:hypothetical protein
MPLHGIKGGFTPKTPGDGCAQKCYWLSGRPKTRYVVFLRIVTFADSNLV